jgi:hypothetical protein
MWLSTVLSLIDILKLVGARGDEPGTATLPVALHVELNKIK